MMITTMEEELQPARPRAKSDTVALYPKHKLVADRRAHRQGVSRSEYIRRLIEEDNPTDFPPERRVE